MITSHMYLLGEGGQMYGLLFLSLQKSKMVTVGVIGVTF